MLRTDSRPSLVRKPYRSGLAIQPIFESLLPYRANVKSDQIELKWFKNKKGIGMALRHLKKLAEAQGETERRQIGKLN